MSDPKCCPFCGEPARTDASNDARIDGNETLRAAPKPGPSLDDGAGRAQADGGEAVNEARNVMERCTTTAAEGSVAWGNHCVLREGHGGAHVFGNCAYERRPIMENDEEVPGEIYDEAERVLKPYIELIPPQCDSHGRDDVIDSTDGGEICEACHGDGFSGELGHIHADTVAIEVVGALWKMVRSTHAVLRQDAEHSAARAEKSEAEAAEWRGRAERAGTAKDCAYAERNALVCALSKLFPASLERHPEADATWDEDWRWIVFIDLPTGQATWHIHDSEFPMFSHLPRFTGRIWDGHTTEEKYRRIAALAAMRAP